MIIKQLIFILKVKNTKNIDSKPDSTQIFSPAHYSTSTPILIFICEPLIYVLFFRFSNHCYYQLSYHRVFCNFFFCKLISFLLFIMLPFKFTNCFDSLVQTNVSEFLFAGMQIAQAFRVNYDYHVYQIWIWIWIWSPHCLYLCMHVVRAIWLFYFLCSHSNVESEFFRMLFVKTFNILKNVVILGYGLLNLMYSHLCSVGVGSRWLRIRLLIILCGIISHN